MMPRHASPLPPSHPGDCELTRRVARRPGAMTAGGILMQLSRGPEPLLKCLEARNEHALAYGRDHLVLIHLVAVEP